MRLKNCDVSWISGTNSESNSSNKMYNKILQGKQFFYVRHISRHFKNVYVYKESKSWEKGKLYKYVEN